MSTCFLCEKTLTAGEIYYYGHFCNDCEREFSQRMSAEMSRPCKWLEADGDPWKHKELLRAERESQ